MSQQLLAGSRPEPAGKISYEEFLEWLDEETHAEWVDGEIVFMSPVTDRHSDVALFLKSLLRLYARERNSGAVRDEPFQMKTGPGLPGRSPDILFVARQNLGRLKRTYLEGPADLVVEIISPDGVHRDSHEKLSEYQQGGVREYWLIDPERQQAEFFHLDEHGLYQPAPAGDDGIYRSVVLPGVWLRVEWLWEEPLPSEISVLREWGVV